MHYSKQAPFYASIKLRETLSKPGSKKSTQHIVIDLEGSGIEYEVGDSLGILPHHDPELVQKTLHALKATGNELVGLKSTGELLSLKDCLREKTNITTISPKLLKAVAEKQTHLEKKERLLLLMLEEQREALKEYLSLHEIWDFLLYHHEVELTPQEFIDLCMPLLPRFYSIASSQKYVGSEVHLTIAEVTYDSNGHARRGVCTHYLSKLVQLNRKEVAVFVQPTHSFRLPVNHDTPLIMIGPGTGIAPFRAFMQERIHHGSKGKHWVFFGEWNKETDFYYEQDWSSWMNQGQLILDLAFSRDQPEKIYVQHKMWQQGEQIYQWLHEHEAYLYVCGDAQKMAKDVEATLLAIIQEYGQYDLPSAREYIKRLRQQKRYLRDVY